MKFGGPLAIFARHGGWLAMAKRKIEDEAEARTCLAEVEAAGGSIPAWARAHGVDGRSLHAWRVNLAQWNGRAPAPTRRRARPGAVAPRLVELVPTTPVRRAGPLPSSAGRYVLEVAGARIELDDEFSEPTLRRLVGVLRSC